MYTILYCICMHCASTQPEAQCVGLMSTNALTILYTNVLNNIDQFSGFHKGSVKTALKSYSNSTVCIYVVSTVMHFLCNNRDRTQRGRITKNKYVQQKARPINCVQQIIKYVIEILKLIPHVQHLIYLVFIFFLSRIFASFK